MATMTDPDLHARAGWRARLPFLAILAVALAGFVLLRDYLSFEALARHREALVALRDAWPLAAPLVFIAAYAAIVALSLPGATVATLAGGFLFATFPGVLYNVTGATAGAVLVFVAARMGFGQGIAARLSAGGGRAAALQEGLKRNQWPVLFLMRLVPAVPFFLANLIPAFLGIRLLPFAVTTFLGILPGALVFTSVGAGLSDVFARGETPDLSILTDPRILWPLVGLCLLAALPLVLRGLRK